MLAETPQKEPVDSLSESQSAFALSPNQERHWFLDQYESDPTVLYFSSVLELSCEFADQQVIDAVAMVARQQPNLSQQFTNTKEGPRRRPFAAQLAMDVTYVTEGGETELRRTIDGKQRVPLDLESGRAASCHLIRGDGRLFLVVKLHPCVADSKSLELFTIELIEALTPDISKRQTNGGSLLQYRGSPHHGEAALRYWIDRIGNDPAPLALPLRAARPGRKGHAAKCVQASLPPDVVGAFERLCVNGGFQMANAYFAVYLVVLHRWSQQHAVTVGWVRDTRSTNELRSIGPFEDVMPFRADFAQPDTFVGFLTDVEARKNDDHLHADVQFGEIVKALQKSRDPSRNPVIQSLFRFTDRCASTSSVASAHVTEAHRFQRLVTPYDIQLEVDRTSRGDSVRILFDEALFDRSAIERFARHYINLLRGTTIEPDGIVDEIPILDPAEETHQLEAFNGTARMASGTRTVLDLFQVEARRWPDAPAVTFGRETLSYAELDTLAHDIATSLRRQGVGQGACVGVCLHRSIPMVATVLGILRAGAAYVPMDPEYPAERIAIMVEDAGVVAVVVAGDTRSRLPPRCRALDYEAIMMAEALDGGALAEVVSDAESLAYVIFTSGSTGRPKGVAMPHRALVNLIEWQIERKTFKSRARVLQYSSLSFDVSFQEIFSTWASGGHLFLIRDEDRRDPRRLLESLSDQCVERLFLPYVALRQMVEAARVTNKVPASLREVITAGEQLRVDDALREFFKGIAPASLDNQYGPSETHVVTAHLLEGDPATWPTLPPIGTPIANNRVYVLDRHRNLLPEGATGELYLAGVNVADGYINRDELTRERFLPDPYSNANEAGAEMYRTGDLARYRPDGSIEFLGRMDHQVKIRGHRIEPGEVDANLVMFPGVKQSLTTVYDDANGKRLVSYVLVEEPGEFRVQALTSFAKTRLPEYMVPATVVALDSFPFTPSGKVDVRSLPAPAAVVGGSKRPVPARTATQAALAKIWQRVLGVQEIGIDDSFFDLGGDSLQAVELFLEIEQRFDQDLPLALLIENPTIEALSRIIDRGGRHEFEKFRSLRLIQRGDPLVAPLFLVHGGGGNVVLFRELATNISKRLPTYAFEWDGWSRRRGRTTIDAMAELYVAELRAAFPKGPYRLGGHCIGGLIAIQMARMLRDLGEEVDGPLVITDTPNLSASTHRTTDPAESSTVAAELAEMKTALFAELAKSAPLSEPPWTEPERSVAQQRFIRMVGRACRLVGYPFNRWRFADEMDSWTLKLCLMAGLPVPRQLRGMYCGKAMVRAARSFRPTPYDGDVVFFRTSAHLGAPLGLWGWWSDLCLGFEELCRANFSVTFVNASHNGVVRHPRTAEIIRVALGIDE